jgi:ssDNA-binding Zn-finger/Zn-ribbon topoisomerase 1
MGEPEEVARERYAREQMQNRFRQEGTQTKRFPIQREPVEMHSVQGNLVDDPVRPGPEIAQEAEKKISTFFKATTHFRAGLPVSCPFCQAAMVVRLRGRDGRAFLGCTRFPNCSGSWDIPDAAQTEAVKWERAMMTPAHTQAMMPRSEADERARMTADQVADMMYMEAAKKDADFVTSVSPGMPSGVITEIRGGTAYAGGQAVGKVMKDAIDEELEKVPARKRGKVPMKEAVDEAMTDAPSNSLKARLARSAKKAPYRVARMRALSEGRKAILAALKSRVQPATFDLVEAFLDTDAGQGAIIGLIGLAGPYTPKLGQNKHVQAICEEFLDEGVAKGANEVFGLLGLILEPVLKSVMSSLPEVNEIADKVVPKRRKKRIAPDVRVSGRERESHPEIQDEEESEARPKNALRAVHAR